MLKGDVSREPSDWLLASRHPSCGGVELGPAPRICGALLAF